MRAQFLDSDHPGHLLGLSRRLLAHPVSPHVSGTSSDDSNYPDGNIVEKGAPGVYIACGNDLP